MTKQSLQYTYNISLPQGGDGPDAEAWKEKTRAALREQSVGLPLAHLGNW